MPAPAPRWFSPLRLSGTIPASRGSVPSGLIHCVPVILGLLILLAGTRAAAAEDPVWLGTYNSPGSARAVQLSGHYAYVADEISGLKIINVSNPASPTLAGTYYTLGAAYSVYLSGNYAYVADWGSGLQIIDVFNQASPTLAGTYDTTVTGKYSLTAAGVDIKNTADWTEITSGNWDWLTEKMPYPACQANRPSAFL